MFRLVVLTVKSVTLPMDINISDLFLNAENLMALMNRCDTKIAVQILYFISESNIFNILYNGK